MYALTIAYRVIFYQSSSHRSQLYERIVKKNSVNIDAITSLVHELIYALIVLSNFMFNDSFLPLFCKRVFIYALCALSFFIKILH